MSDMVDEKDEKKAEPPTTPPAPAKPRGPVWPKVMKVWIALLVAAWGATLVHLLSLASWLGPATITLREERLSPAGSAVGAAAAVGLLFLIFKKFGKSLLWTKPGQGTWVRASTLGALGSLTVFGCTALFLYLYISLASDSSWLRILYRGAFIGKPFSIRPILFPTVGILTTVMFAVFLLLNQEKWTDFLIETEGELKKVSWPARKEYVGSATVVVMVVAIVSLFLYFVDHGMSRLFGFLKIGF